mgnify:FL=1
MTSTECLQRPRECSLVLGKLLLLLPTTLHVIADRTLKLCVFVSTCSAAAADSNKGWGLGTLYDATHTDSDYVCGPDGAETARPQCDAQMHTIGGNWGTSSGTGGMIGTDNVCVSDCEWTTESGYYYDYAIFVR